MEKGRAEGSAPVAETQRPVRSAHAERDRFQAHPAIDLDGEMQMRPGGEARIPGQPDLLPRLNPLTNPHQYAGFLQVGVQRHGAVVVRDADEVGAATEFFPRRMSSKSSMPRSR